MLKTVKSRGLALLATVALLGGTAWIASGTTGAYFSDTQSGAINGSLGTIKVVANGSTGAALSNISFPTMMPGEPQTVTVNYKNTGTSAQDVWINFNNVTALSALNNLGSYGELHIVNTNSVNHVTHVFDSANLDDNPTECHGFSTAGCWPLPNKVQVASNVASGASGSVSFTFNYAGALDNASQGVAFNHYPALSGPYDATTNRQGQYQIEPSQVGDGLPFQIVATQVNQKP